MADVLTASAWEAAQQLVAVARGARMRYSPSTADPKYVGIRSRVARVELVVGEHPVGTAVVKQRCGDAGYDPADLSAGSLATRVAYEAASLSFLAQLDCRRLAPRLIGVDYAEGVLVLEDLGEGPGLLEHLLGDSPDAADHALRVYATALGELHACSAGQVGRFAEALADFGSRPVKPSVLVELQIDEFVESVETVGVTVPTDVRGRLRATVQRMQSPGPYLALTHGDVCPGHDRIINDQSMFIDLELGGFRHAFYDLAYLFVPFPSCGFAGRLPSESVDLAVSAYRSAAARGIPAVADDAAFTTELTYAWTYWIIRNVAGLVPTVVDEDSVWGNATCRQRLIQQVGDLAAFLSRQERDSHLAPWLSDLARALARRWPTTMPLPLAPAYIAIHTRQPLA